MPRLLLLCERFAPHRQVGALRPGSFARFLPAHGWDVTVVTRRHGLRGEAPAFAPGVDIVYLEPEPHAAPTSAGAGAARRRLRSMLFDVRTAFDVPDANIRAWRRLTAAALAAARSTHPDVVLSTSPPHAIHVAGRAVARDLGIPWVADFRDPMVGDSRYGAVGPRRLRARAVDEYEAAVYRDADVVLHAPIALHGTAEARHRGAGARMVSLPNGFPPDLLEAVDRHAAGSPVRVVAVGTSGPAELREIAAVVDTWRGGDRPVLVTAGTMDQASPTTVHHGVVDHGAAIDLIAGADVLVCALPAARARTGALTSRLFEFVATGRPILLLNPTAEDEAFVRDHPNVVVRRRPGSDDLRAALEGLVRRPPRPDPDALQHHRETFRRDALTARLAAELDLLVRDRSQRD